MGRLFGQSDPNTVLLVLFRGAEGDVSECGEDTDDGQLNVREVNQSAQQTRFVVKEIEGVVGPGLDLHDRVGGSHLLQFLAQQNRILENTVGNQVGFDHIKCAGGDDKGNIGVGIEDIA